MWLGSTLCREKWNQTKGFIMGRFVEIRVPRSFKVMLSIEANVNTPKCSNKHDGRHCFFLGATHHLN